MYFLATYLPGVCHMYREKKNLEGTPSLAGPWPLLGLLVTCHPSMSLVFCMPTLCGVPSGRPVGTDRAREQEGSGKLFLPLTS